MTDNKAIVIGIDGAQLNKLEGTPTPNLDSLNLIESFTGGIEGTETEQETFSGPGWGTLLTGVWANKHGIISNDDTLRANPEFPSIFEYVHNDDPAHFIASVVNWGPINAYFEEDVESIVDFELTAPEPTDDNLAQDNIIAPTVADLILEEAPDYTFVHLDKVDVVGHDLGFSPEYLDAITAADGHVGTILDAVEAREAAYPNEDWLVLVTTDHGRELPEGFDHGGQTDSERTTFIASNKALDDSEAAPATDVVPTVLDHLEIEGGEFDGESLFSQDNLLKTATYNIHHGSGNDDQVDLDRIAKVIADVEPHVVSLQENDIVNGRTDFVNQPQVIAEKVSELTNQEWVALEAPAIEFSDGEYGNAIIYNDDVLDSTEFQNVLLPGNSEGDGRRSAGIGTFGFGETDFQFVATHFTNLNEATEDGSTLQLDSLNIINNSVSTDLPVILAGDLNADINPVLTDGQLSDNNPETIEELVDLGYQIVSPFDDDSDTVPSEEFDGVIDYIAIKNGEEFEVESSQIIDSDLTNLASDHYPVTATFSLPSTLPTPRSEALPNTHGHNDYEHEYPLFDALSNGFVSVEADIWLYPNDGENLRVAHDPVEEPTTLPTLEELYLDPLQDLHEELDNGGVYADGTPLTLLIDLKSEGLPTYQRLDEVLAEYQSETPGLFTTYSQDETGNYTVTPGAVTPIISGDRPREYMESQEVRYAGYDGRKDDIGTDVDPGFMPLISDNWDNFFTGDLAWDGTGTIPADTEAELNEIVAEVQEEDKMLRFWNLPQDAPSVWEPLYEAGVDLINTDDLEGLSTFIESQLAGDRRQEPIVIAHRGASGELPPHTLAAYELAIAQGADFIEPDLVITEDGELVARHDPNLIFSTDVRYHPEFADRLDTEIVGDDRGGAPQDGYFVKDFTLEEVKTLGAIQDQDFRDQSFNGQFEIATLDEIIALVQEVEAETGRKIGIYPEIKHSEYFNAAGLDIEQALVETLQEQEFTDPNRIYVQSFQVESLTKLQDLMAGTPLEDTPLVQLYGDPTAQPHDIVKNFSNPDFDPTAVYGTAQIDGDTTYGDLINLDDDPNVNLLADFVATYADAIGPNEDWVYVTEELAEPVDADGDGIAQVTQQLTGEVLPVIDDAHEAGLDVHIWTFRNEERYQLLDEQGNVETPEEALMRVIESGADGFFTDFPATGVKVRDRLASQNESDDETPVFGTVNSDTLEIKGSNQFVFAGEDEDLIDASLASGSNRIYGDGGDDTFVLGAGDRAFGGDGDDRFFAQTVGENTITGGAGADQFWIAVAEIPEAANTITDFMSGEDVIGIAGLGIGFDDLSITAIEGDALISGLDSELAILQGVDAASLNADNFAFA